MELVAVEVFQSSTSNVAGCLEIEPKYALATSKPQYVTEPQPERVVPAATRLKFRAIATNERGSTAILSW